MLETEPRRSQDQGTTDFAPAEINKALRQETLSSPGFIYPIAGGVLGAVTTAAIGLSGPIGFTALAAAAAAFLIGGGTWLYKQNIVRGARMARHIQRMHQQLTNRIKQRQQQLDDQVRRSGHSQAEQQLQSLREKFDNFRDLLARRFNPEELTYNRYLGTCEQVYLGALDNLQAIVDNLRAMHSMDPDLLEKNHAEATQRGDQQTANALSERIGIYQMHQSRVSAALARNETAITRVSQAIAALIALDTGQGMASSSLDNTMNELQQLAINTQDYAS